MSSNATKTGGSLADVMNELRELASSIDDASVKMGRLHEETDSMRSHMNKMQDRAKAFMLRCEGQPKASKANGIYASEASGERSEGEEEVEAMEGEESAEKAKTKGKGRATSKKKIKATVISSKTQDTQDAAKGPRRSSRIEGAEAKKAIKGAEDKTESKIAVSASGPKRTMKKANYSEPPKQKEPKSELQSKKKQPKKLSTPKEAPEYPYEIIPNEEVFLISSIRSGRNRSKASASAPTRSQKLDSNSRENQDTEVQGKEGTTTKDDGNHEGVQSGSGIISALSRNVRRQQRKPGVNSEEGVEVAAKKGKGAAGKTS